MDVLMAALMVAALAQLGERTPRLAALLADRYRPAPVMAGALVALAAVYGAGAMLGAALAPTLSPNAALILLALSLLVAAGGLATSPKAPDRLEDWRLGGLPTAALGVAILAFGDGAQFVTAALSAYHPLPVMAGAGAALGGFVPLAAAAAIGEAAWQRLPLRPARLAAAAVLTAAGAVLGLLGARLI